MRTTLRITTAVLGISWFAPLVGAQLIVNGSFEQPLAPLNERTTVSELPGWMVNGNVDAIHTGFWQAADGVQSLDLSGENSGPGNYIEQAFPTVVGEAYALTFFYGNNNGDPWALGRVSVSGASTLLSRDLQHSGSTAQAMDYTLFGETFMADSPTTVLRFTHFDSPTPFSRGLALDGVAVQPVPEPSSLALFGGFGVVGILLYRRTRRKPNPRAAPNAGGPRPLAIGTPWPPASVS